MLNEKTLNAIENFAKYTPKDIDKPIHSTDEFRMFDIAKAVMENGDALSDVKEELVRALTDDFAHAKELADYIANSVGIINRYTSYINRGC